jgi:hypothetical protein
MQRQRNRLIDSRRTPEMKWIGVPEENLRLLPLSLLHQRGIEAIVPELTFLMILERRIPLAGRFEETDAS